MSASIAGSAPVAGSSADSAAFVKCVASALEPDGPIARAHPGFTARAGQRRMAIAVAEAIEHAGSLVAEAGTGTGKTFAYLVPALLCGGRVLISTGTRTLQDQLFRRDLPRVRAALGVAPTIALLKGRANYVCKHHLRRNLEEGRVERGEDAALLRRIDRFAAVSASGDRSAAPGIPEDSPAWSKATSTRENCLGQDCPELAGCFVFRARQAAQHADVVVVNHHLFCADLALRDEGISELLPSVDAVIFDEAHQLPEIAVQFFGRSVSTRQLGDFARDLLRIGMVDAADAADWIGINAELEHALRVWRLVAGGKGRRDAPQLRADRGQRAALLALRTLLERIDEVLLSAAQRSRDLARLAVRAGELHGRLANWLSLLDAGAGALGEGRPASGERFKACADEASPRRETSMAGGSPRRAQEERPADEAPMPEEAPTSDRAPAPDEAVLWGEVHQAGVTLHATPLSVAPVMRRHREATRQAWVFVSATLSVAGDFSHFVDAIGIDEARTLTIDSPFDYAVRARLLVPRGCGDPNSEGYAQRVAALCWPLLQANRGRAFVLCTSLRMVDLLGTLLRERAAAQDEPMELLIQGSAARGELLDRFRSAAQPVLIGSASFWEGVDVVGEQLSLVIIDKLPFAPPGDPVLRARTEALRRSGGDPFHDLQLPAAAMALKQGAGRLIRSEADRGLLVVCDERLVTRGYGRSLVRSLPPFGLLRDCEEALTWLAGAHGEPALAAACGDGASGLADPADRSR